MGGKYQNYSSRNDMGGAGWIELVQDEDKWRAVVNTAMNIQVL
jgi:hypothetical protein